MSVGSLSLARGRGAMAGSSEVHGEHAHPLLVGDAQ